MITTRTAKQCGQADYGWLQARYTFSFDTILILNCWVMPRCVF